MDRCQECNEPMLQLALDPNKGEQLVCSLCAEEMYEGHTPSVEEIMDTIAFGEAYPELRR